MKSRTIAIAVLPAIAIIVMLGSSIGAPPALAQETISQASQPDPQQFARGAQLWANTCARCHNMRDPQELRDDQWRTVMAHMRVRAGMSGEDARAVLVFLQGAN